MDIMVKLALSQTVYNFYHRASAFVADSSPEQIMADALTAYAGMLTQDNSAPHPSPPPEGAEA